MWVIHIHIGQALTHRSDTCFCGHSGSGAPLLKYHGNRLPLKKRQILKQKSHLLQLSCSKAAQGYHAMHTLQFTTCLPRLIRCFRSPDTHSSLLISSALKSFRVRKLRPCKFTEPRDAAPALQKRQQVRKHLLRPHTVLLYIDRQQNLFVGACLLSKLSLT